MKAKKGSKVYYYKKLSSGNVLLLRNELTIKNKMVRAMLNHSKIMIKETLKLKFNIQ